MSTDQVLKSLAAITLCGILVRLVMRGKWIAWAHPVCSRCLFNLQGLPETSQRCPECGEELAKVRRNSVWRRRWISLGISLVMILATMFVVSNEIPFRHLNRVLPTSVLLRELDIPSLRPYVWNDLWQRTASGELTPVQISAMIDEAIKEPRYENTGILQAMRQRGILPANKLAAAAASAITTNVSLRRHIARGDPLVVNAVCSVWLVGITPKLSLKVLVDGIPLTLPPGFVHEDGRNYAWASYLIELPPELLAGTKDGSHSVDIFLDVQLSDIASGAALTSKKIREAYSFTLLPVGKQSVDVISPEHLPSARRLRDYLLLDEVYLDGSSPLFRQFGPVERSSGSPLHDGIDLAYQLLASSNGKTQLLGTMIISNETRRWSSATTRPSGLGDRTDIIFRTDPVAAARTIDIIHISGDEFIVPNVRVKSKPPPDAEQP